MLGQHSHAAVADVDLQHHVERAARGPEGLGQRARAVQAVDADRQAHAVRKREQPASLVLADRGVGEKHVVEARLGEDLGLADLGERQAACARRALQRRDRGALVGLGVRPQPHSGLARPRGHALDVPLEHVEVDDDSGGCERFGRGAEHGREPITAAAGHPAAWIERFWGLRVH